MVSFIRDRRWPVATLVLVLWTATGLGAAQAQAGTARCGGAGSAIPERPLRASGADAFIESVAALGDHERDRAIRDELLRGNIPRFLRSAWPATLSAVLPGGAPVRLTLCVLSDYLSLGSDDDFLIVPLALDSALKVASTFGFTLPTRRIVDLIYRQAPLRLVPQPLPAGDRMRSTEYLRRHDRLVQAQRLSSGAAPGLLTAGHKKDVVLSTRLWSQPGKLAIFGWHRAEGQPIQPLSTVHGERYADYSHGIRLVSQTVYVDDQPRSIFEVLADPRLSALLSDEGPLPLSGAGSMAGHGPDR